MDASMTMPNRRAWWLAMSGHRDHDHDHGHERGSRGGFGRRGGGRMGGGPWGGGPGGGRKARRGDTRDAVLLLLLEGPKHGYQLMTELGERSNGRWTPSPGSIYPVMRSLGDAGLITSEEAEGRRTFSLTDDGRTIAERRRDGGPAPWEAMADDEPEAEHTLREAAMRLLPALRQLAHEGSPEAITDVTAKLDALRRDVYRHLAD